VVLILQKTKPKAMCKLRTASVVLNPKKKSVYFWKRAREKKKKLWGLIETPINIF